MTIQNPHLVHADEMVASLNDSTKVKDEDPNSDKVPNDVENHPQVENHVKESDKISEHVPEDRIIEKAVENTVKTVDKTTLNELIEKIRNTDLQTKTAKSVENLNLSLSRAQAVLDKAGTSQDEIDKEVQALSDSFAQLEEKSNDIDKKEKQADKANDSDEKKNLLTEKIAKVQALVSEINQLAGEISYEFSESESKSLQAFGDLSEEKSTDSEVDGALNEAKSLRNKVANRVTRAQSGKRDPRNGKPIDGKGESGFRAIWISSIANKYEGSNALVNENKKELTFYNSDTLFSVMTAYGKRGNGEPLVRYPNGPKRGEEDPTPYYVKRVGIISGLDQVNGLKLRVAYKNFQTGKKEEVDIAANYWNVNNPEVQMALVGTIGNGGNVTPGTYHITIGANGKNKQNTITYTLTIKPQSERNTVNNLTPTYVDDVRHLTETEKNALIEKFKAEHPNVVNRANHIDFDHAEVSADGATMTIHFKDGFNPKTIQTNATNDVEAKHSSLTAYFGDSKEIYTNPRELVRSKTGHEVPTTAQVTYKTPFNLQQAGTRNVVVTTTYQNGVSKDVTTPYTVLDFIGKQDKKINQNQSGQLGDARNYVTVSNNSAIPRELTVRWKGGSSNVDTSAAGIQHKEIEILRGNHLMKTVNIPVEIVDNIKPTITAPDNITLTRLEGLPSEINIHAQDNDKGVGLKESNSVTVDNLPNPLSYNAKKSKIEINGVIPNNFQLGKSSIQVTVKAVDKKGNTATKNITFHIQSQTQKYTAVANSQIQEVSYGEAPDAGTSIQKNGLPTGTRYGWATQPNTTTGPGDKTEFVTVSYPDGSTDTVTVTVKVRKLSDEHIPTGKTIAVNQNDSVTSDRLKAAVTVDNGGTRKVKSVTASPVSTVHAGPQTIKATVTYLDNTTDPVDIPLEVKDVTPPTIQTPAENTNWEVTALDKALPNMEVRAEDNENGSGIKNVTVTGLPDYLDYDSPTHTIKFKSGKDAVEKLAGNTPSQEFTLNIRAEDKAGNVSERTAKITVSSMSAKTNPTPIPQNTSYGQVPDSNASVDKAGLPDGTKVTWKTPPVVNTPGTTTGVAEVTYPDGSKDVVTVNVTVRKVSEDFTATGTQIEVNQNVSVTPEMLKGAVTATNAQGENGNSKIATVESKTPINTEAYGDQTIQAKVTYIDGSEQDVTIPLKVKDVTDPTIQTPAEHTNWGMTALDKTLPPMKIEAKDNANGSGVATIEVNNMPSFLTFDQASGTIVFKEGVREVPRIDSDNVMYGVTIVARDKAGNSTSILVNITVWSMRGKYSPTAIAQEVDNGHVPNPETSVNKTGLPEGTTVTWKTRPDVSTPGSHPGVALVHYPDGTEDEVEVPVTVKKQSDTFNPTAKEPNQTVRHKEVPDPEKSINTNDLPAGTNYSWSEQPDTSKPGSKTGKVLITYPDKSTEEVTVTVNVTPQKDEYTPTGIPQEVDNGHVPDPETSVNKTGLPEGTTVTWKTRPDVSTPGSHPGVALVHYPDGTEDEVEVPVRVKEQKDTFNPTAKEPNQTVRHKEVPDPEKSINTNDLPKGTNYSWSEQPDTSKPGNKPGKVLITYPDNSTEEVPVTVEVTPQKDEYNPTAIAQEVDNGHVPDPETSVNKTGLPEGTSVTWKTRPDVSTPGSKTGKVLITYPDKSTEEVTVTVNVTPQNDEYTPTGIPQEVDNGHVPDPETSVTKTGLPEGTTVTWKTRPDVSTPGSHPGVALVHYPDGTEDEVEVPVRVKEQKDTFNPTAKEPNQTVRHNEVPDPEKSINTTDLPAGTNYSWSEQPDTSKPGSKTGKVLITYPDHSTEEVTVTVNVTPQNDEYSPTGIAQTVDNGHVPDPETSVNKTGLPEGTTVTWKETPVVNTPGSHPGVALVHYPDGTEDEVEVPVTVKKQSDTFNPTAKEPNQTVRHNEVPDPEKSINTNDLPKGTNYSWSEQPDTSKPGSKTGKVLITYPDKSTEEVTVTVNVTPQNDDYTPTGIPQEVDNGHVPDPETSVTKTGLPEGTTVTWKTRPDVSTPGSHPGVALVHYPDGTEDEVEVPVRVKEQKDTFNPTAKEPNQTVRHNEVPDPEKSINTNDLPKGTNYSWSEQPDTSKPGSKTGKVLITYPDHSTEEVTVTVNVTPQKDDYDPQPKAQTVEHAQVPSAKDSIENVKTLPEGTTFGWKDGKIPDTSKHGEKKGVVTVTYPDGSTEDVDVVITVNPEDFSPVVPMEKVPVKNPENLSPEEQDKVKEKVTKANPGKDVTVDSKGNVTITDPETKVSHEISRDKLVFAYAKGVPEILKIPEFNGGVNTPDSPVHGVPEFAGGVNGEPEIQETLPEFNGGVNAPNSPTHEVPEFNGGVNGDLPDPVEVPKVQLIITKWVDENGKELKPADSKAPTVLGEANEAFEHGEIEGYVFVRTETKGDVVTHIFRKVSPVRPTGDAQQRPAAPSYDTNPRPDIATPAEVPATQPAGQPSQTVEVSAQLQNEVSETNPSVSQPKAILPNTGTQEDRATGAIGVLSLLGAFGLLFAKKKKDDEEEA
ncbi:Rib/alpha-like domain-containing protein [Streptococcus mitis]|uniref:SIALI-17 repeat-containing surface protein n=1 Tax=Streptococcus mitis TaxID=28037 RepID=UPI0039C37CC3